MLDTNKFDDGLVPHGCEMLFNFTLDSVDEIQPWGESPQLSLGWFGLTSGTYHLDVGANQLLCYSDDCLRHLSHLSQTPRRTRFVDYQVARLYEDIFEMLPSVLEPIPQDLESYARNVPGQAWLISCKRWLDEQPDDDSYSPPAWEKYYQAVSWRGKRTLDTGYLSPNANIWFWRSEDIITIEWDNSGLDFEGVPAWSAIRGSYSMTVESFLNELRCFHESLIEQMRVRVSDVCHFWERDQIHIDQTQLIAEQSQREQSFESFYQSGVVMADWTAVVQAIREIEACVSAEKSKR